MPRLTFTLYPNHGRTVFRDSDVTTLTTRSNNANGWKDRWEQSLLVSAGQLESTKTAAQLAADRYNFHNTGLLLATTGLIDNLSAYRQKAIDAAKYYASTYANQNHPDGDFTRTVPVRVGALAQAFIYDALFNSSEMTSGNAATIRAGIKLCAANLTSHIDNSQLLDGHSAGNAVALLACGLAIAAEDSAGTTYINTALNHWYGSTAGDNRRLDYDRYFGADGGSAKGTWYAILSQWYTTLFLRLVHNGFVRNADTADSLLLDTQPYAPWSSETWLQKVPEWILRTCFRQDKDYIPLADTYRTDNPVFSDYLRFALGTYIARGGPWRKVSHWLYNQLEAWQQAQNGIVGYQRIYDFINFDAADAANAATAPQDASPAIPRARFFTPPGHYHYLHPSWDIPQTCDVHVHLSARDFTGHGHNNIGEIQIGIKGDRVLLASNYYHTSDAAADFGGTHHRNWTQQSISKSGVPLIEGLAADASDEHYSRDAAGDRATFKNGLGGQCYKTIGGLNGQFGPENIDDLRHQGGDLAWLRCTAAAPWGTAGAVADFITADLRRAYLKEYTDFDGAVERVRRCDLRLLVLKDVAPWPVIFRVLRIQSRIATLKQRDHWHFARAPIFDVARRVRGLGAAGTGWVVIDYYNRDQFTFTTIGGGTQSDGYGSRDFLWDGINRRPSDAIRSARSAADLGHYRIEVAPAQPVEEVSFVCLLMPMQFTENPVDYTLSEEPNWWVADFAGRQFRIHKTADEALLTIPDTEPPQVPQNPHATPGPDSGQVTLGCDPNDDDTKLYRIQYR